MPLTRLENDEHYEEAMGTAASIIRSAIERSEATDADVLQQARAVNTAAHALDLHTRLAMRRADLRDSKIREARRQLRRRTRKR